MWKEEKIINYLKSNLKEDRFKHSLSVRDTAEKLATIYGADIEKAKIAGLVHDCAKNMSNEDLIKIAKDNGVIIDEVFYNSPQLMHGLVGSIIAKQLMGIEDKEILDAIKYHTTGKKNMTLLEKVIYIADYIEPTRKFPGVCSLRQQAYTNLDKAVLLSFNDSIKFIIDSGKLIHNLTIEARNYLLMKR